MRTSSRERAAPKSIRLLQREVIEIVDILVERIRVSRAELLLFVARRTSFKCKEKWFAERSDKFGEDVREPFNRHVHREHMFVVRTLNRIRLVNARKVGRLTSLGQPEIFLWHRKLP